MTPLAIAAIAAFYAACACALIVLAKIAADDPESEREPRHLYTGDPEQVVDAHPVPEWALRHYKPRHLALAGGES